MGAPCATYRSRWQELPVRYYVGGFGDRFPRASGRVFFSFRFRRRSRCFRDGFFPPWLRRRENIPPEWPRIIKIIPENARYPTNPLSGKLLIYRDFTPNFQRTPKQKFEMVGFAKSGYAFATTHKGDCATKRKSHSRRFGEKRPTCRFFDGVCCLKPSL